MIYLDTNDDNKGIPDVKKACEMGHTFACEVYPEVLKEVEKKSYKGPVPENPAKRWKYFTMNAENGSRYFYDSNSLLYITKNTVRVWIKIQFIEGEKKSGGLKDLKEMDNLYEINCSQRKSRIVSIVSRRPWDGNIDIDDEPTAWSTVNPESIVEDLSKIVCRKTKRK